MDLEQLAQHVARSKDRPIMDLFSDPNRAADFSVHADCLLFDYSKTNIDRDTRAFLFDTARAADVAGRRDAMFEGERINETEGRAVLHTALRAAYGTVVKLDGENIVPAVRATRDRMAEFARAVRNGSFRGQGGAITDVVNIGIGGSDLGPLMAVRALTPYSDGPCCHFVSNIDGAHLADTLAPLNPETTLIIVASKTFTTVETMTNAHSARDWMATKVKDPAAQFVALSTAADRTAAFGIPAEQTFGFEDWVGGRYSVWGPIGLALGLSIGADNFADFLAGARAMDDHFRKAPLERNLPMLLALVGLWHHQGMGYATRAVLPYEQRLERLPAYLQQLEMESNGKRVTMSGDALETVSGPVVWGEPGTNGQHAFFQLIHQGTAVVPCEFMVAKHGHEAGYAHHHRLLIGNCLAQSEALLKGRTFEEARASLSGKGFEGEELDRQARHRVFPGNRPSTTLIYDQLTPFVLGQLLALYEHRVFVEGVILGINSFDQWGVELGKELAKDLDPILTGSASAEGKDPSTQMLINHLRPRARKSN
jgi:glucose-6-phosphate isomerase